VTILKESARQIHPHKDKKTNNAVAENDFIIYIKLLILYKIPRHSCDQGQRVEAIFASIRDQIGETLDPPKWPWW
jgi:hypothetical protein